MTDIFVSYKREDFPRVERLVTALRGEGFDVWWDQDIPPGAAWEAAITAALDKARCVLACWSEVSVHPQLGAKVQVEARFANDAGKLLQVKLEPTNPPLFFRQWQAADLAGWNGDSSDSAFQRIAAAARALLSGAAPAAFAEPARAPRKRARRKALLAAAAAGAAFLGAGAVTLASPDAQLTICELTNPNGICLGEAEIADYEAALAGAKIKLAQRAIFYINDRRQNFPSIAWAISQLAASNTDGLADHRAAFDSRLADLIDPQCGCLTYGPAPHTMSNAWFLVTTAKFGEPAPPTVVDAVIAGQSVEGWWSATLDAVDAPDNGAIYATAFMVSALERQFGLTADEARRSAIRRSVEAGAGWLVTQISSSSGFLPDYPQSLRNLKDPGIDGAALAALSQVRPDIDLKARAARLARALDRLPPLWTTQSSDVLVRREGGAQYYDDFRHIGAAWTVLGAVSGLKDLSPLERARVLLAVRRVFRRDLASPELFEREWVAAEAIFALGESVERLKAYSTGGLGRAGA